MSELSGQKIEGAASAPQEVDRSIEAQPLGATGDGKLEPDRGQLEVFVKTVFRHASLKGFVSLRTFLHERGKPAFRITPINLKGGLDFLIEAAEDDARRAAQHPTPLVFCPPTATFTSKEHAREEDTAEGFVISAELDQHPRESLEALQAVLGPATVIVKSGGVWTNGGTSTEEKLHVYWVLTKPASTTEDLAKLKRARNLAAFLVRGDTSNVPVNHPIRWPGSWHRKAEPRMAVIETVDADREVDLDAALLALAEAAQAAGVFVEADTKTNDELLAREPDMCACACGVVENNDLEWADWVKRGLAISAAFEDKDVGFELFDAFSRKSEKYNERETRRTWQGFLKRPPNRIGAGSIYEWADDASDTWRDEYDALVEEALNRAAEAGAAFRGEMFGAAKEAKADSSDERTNAKQTKDAGPRSSASKSDAGADGEGKAHEGKSAGARTADAEALARLFASGDGEQAHAKKPLLWIRGGNLPAVAKEFAKLLAADNHFLSNGHAPVMVVVEDGMPRAIAVSADCVRTTAHELCRPVKNTKTKENGIVRTDVTLTKDIALLYLSGLEGRWGLKTFRGIASAPILKGDGSFRVAQGYDTETGLWCHSIPAIDVADRPSEDDARAALLRLRRYFRTFPFADSERTVVDGIAVTDTSKPPALDESIFLAALLTAVTRQSLDFAPAFLCDAPTFSGAGTGKGLLVKAIVIIGSGMRPAAFTSGHDVQEFDKRLTAALVEARPAVFLDNFNAKDLASDVLASAITEDPAMVRPMGLTKTVPLHTRTLIVITGNGVQIAEDMARRILKTCLDARMENPKQRSFAPGFLDGVHADRTTLLADALTVWRWGRQKEQLEPGLPIGNFETWALWCRDPLLALGCRDPVDRIAEIKASDPRRAAIAAFFEAWWSEHADSSVKAGDIGDVLNELADFKSNRKADGTLVYSRQRVARFLTRHAGTCVGGFTFVQEPATARTRPVYYYKLTPSDERLAAADKATGDLPF